jgi:hypothetical protein
MKARILFQQRCRREEKKKPRGGKSVDITEVISLSKMPYGL